MSVRKLTDAAQMSLKAAQRRLIRAAGGLESAASVTRVNKTTLGYYGQIEHEQHMAADVIGDLEADVGDPIVTRELARLAGYQLVPLGESAAPTSVDPTQMVVGLSREIGDFARAVEDMDEDGVREPHEMRKCLAVVGDVIERAERYRADLHLQLAASRAKSEER